MGYSYEQLDAMNVTQLRAVAAGIQHDAVHGFSTMHKEKLIPALCTALGIEAHKHHQVVGIDKTAVKAEIHALKKQRVEALAGKQHDTYRDIIHKIHELKNKLRRATV